MHKITAIFSLVLLTCLALAGPLDDYVYKPDPAYAFKLIATEKHATTTLFVLNMTSQTWPFSLTPLWWHLMEIIVPNNASFLPSTAMLMIEGGSKSSPVPKDDAILEPISAITQSVIVKIGQIPNQPLSFANDTLPSRVEDQIMAWTWKQYMDTGNPLVLGRMPMVKASVRAMDTVQTFMKQQFGVAIEKFVVVGASKRGWTTWLTGAVEFDKRVIGIAPVVIDVPNMAQTLTHIYQQYCFWPEAMKDYLDEGIMQRIQTQPFHNMAGIIDPLAYNNRYVVMPKLVVSSTGDQFFASDSATQYYHLIDGEKLLRYVPNTDHSLKGSDVYETIVTYFATLAYKKARPSYEWNIERSNTNGTEVVTITVMANTTHGVPTTVLLWQADNANARDFRKQTIGAVWQSSDVPTIANTPQVVFYQTQVAQPAKGWRAFMVELTYANVVPGVPTKLKVTTTVNVTPDTLPCW